VQEGLIADAPQQIRRSRRIGLTQILQIVEMQNDAVGTMADRVAKQVAQHPGAIQQQCPRWHGHAFAGCAASTSGPAADGQFASTAT